MLIPHPSLVYNRQSKKQRQKLISEGIASFTTFYSYSGCETKVIFSFVPHPFYYQLIHFLFLSIRLTSTHERGIIKIDKERC
ncbi:hypothetical protein CI088_04240 [Enterococcus plantarum]|uniref:Uncharacterized protein n=1 Tax=Enterococcus plantarum TaxID=1077675 RepID=A0A2W4BQH1_9ENTE|nr:hypothetical protein CI088_04240 [Enterococcus plantarum]